MKKLLWFLPMIMLVVGITSAAPAEYTTRAQEHFELLNEYRIQNNLLPLEWNQDLADCVKDYLYKQINENFHGHYWPDGSTPTTRCAFAQLWGIGENLIASTNYFADPQRALNLWISSPSHKKNMLEPTYKYVGVAAVWDPVAKQSRRWQAFAYWTSLTSNTQTPWNVWQTNQNSTTPKLVSRNIEKVSHARKSGKKYLRLQLTLDWDVDRTKMSTQLSSIATTLWNTFLQL